MHPAYFETRFQIESAPKIWPSEFVILSGFATTGTIWTDERNEQSDKDLERTLRKLGVWLYRMIGYSPTTGHAEPSWAAELQLVPACELGVAYAQDAIYHVRDGELFVVQCVRPDQSIRVDEFRNRVDSATRTI